MRIVIDWDLCESNAICEGFAPSVFRVNDDDELELLVDRPDESRRDEIDEAVRCCPRGAISIVDE